MIHNLRERIFDLFDGPTLTQLATVNVCGHPWVRYVMSTIDHDMVLRIPTGRLTRKVREIRERPDVHLLVGQNLFSGSGAYAQIEGHAVIRTDPRMRAEVWDPGMNRYFTGCDDPNYVLIEIRPYRVEYWSAMEEENPNVLEQEDLAQTADSMDDEFWVAEGQTVPVFAL